MITQIEQIRIDAYSNYLALPNKEAYREYTEIIDKADEIEFYIEMDELFNDIPIQIQI